MRRCASRAIASEVSRFVPSAASRVMRTWFGSVSGKNDCPTEVTLKTASTTNTAANVMVSKRARLSVRIDPGPAPEEGADAQEDGLERVQDDADSADRGEAAAGMIRAVPAR